VPPDDERNVTNAQITESAGRRLISGPLQSSASAYAS
jgi:hypothetical protein